MHHSSKGESLGKCVLCSLKAISCTGQSTYLFCTWKQMICSSFCFWARFLISIVAKRRKRKKPLYEYIVITLLGMADIWCPIPSQSCLTFEWPKPLEATRGISWQERPGENGAVAEHSEMSYWATQFVFLMTHKNPPCSMASKYGPHRSHSGQICIADGAKAAWGGC